MAFEQAIGTQNAAGNVGRYEPPNTGGTVLRNICMFDLVGAFRNTKLALYRLILYKQLRLGSSTQCSL